jgi:hypothetical protein
MQQDPLRELPFTCSRLRLGEATYADTTRILLRDSITCCLSPETKNRRTAFIALMGGEGIGNQICRAAEIVVAPTIFYWPIIVVSVLSAIQQGDFPPPTMYTFLYSFQT